MPKRIDAETEAHIMNIVRDTPDVTLEKIAERTGVSISTAGRYVKGNVGSYSRSTYENERVKKAGFSSRNKYAKWLAEQRGETISDTRERVAKARGFSSSAEYSRNTRKLHKQEPRCEELSDFLNAWLDNLGRTRQWLAWKIEKHEETVCRYARGESYPRIETLNKIYIAIGEEYSLEYRVKNAEMGNVEEARV